MPGLVPGIRVFHLAPRAGRGRIASPDAMRVRGSFRGFGARIEPLTLTLSPQAGRGKRTVHYLNLLASISLRILRRMPLLVSEASCHHQPSRFIFSAAATKRFSTSVKSASV